jgi:hypothetical protein
MSELTNDEMTKTPMSVHQKFLDYGFEVEGWMDKVNELPCVEK